MLCYIFLVGVAGGIKDVKIGDVVIGTIAYGYEYGKVTKEGFEVRPRAVSFSSDIINVAKQLSREILLNDYKIVFGPINLGEKVIANSNSDQYKIIKSHFGDTIAVEMESIGFAEVAIETNNLSFGNIRGISDLLDNKAETDNSGSQEIASKNVAKFFFLLLEKLAKKKKDFQKVKIFYTEERYSTFSWRTLKSTEIGISDHLIIFKGSAPNVRLRG